VSAGLTDEAFWRSYWASKELVRVVDERDTFYPLLRESAPPGARTFVELGGFPGYYAVLARRLLGLEATLVDLVLEREPLARLLAANGLAEGDVRAVQGDLFELPSLPRFDVVFSSGLVEHFEEPERILAAHAGLAAPGGVVVVTVPNFRGLNGLVQRVFDPETLAVHNLEAMVPGRLLAAATACGLERAEAFHYGGLQVWLERLDRRAAPVRGLVRALDGLGRRLPRRESRALSAHVVLRARKP
jgi:SAM-dependent methyltransferase